MKTLPGEDAFMEKKNVRTRSWLLLAAVGLLLAAICFAVLGVTHVVSPVTAIGNVAGFLITSLVIGVLAVRK
ncbi:sodium:proton antiporter [Mobiluncus curtisii]|nr:sodium:proton antiporter [Mobiluncus curtisii]MCV0000597.1 sodium:proton antiporter [Mobiluncus curtisii]NMW48422.1 sodium:proton antiporter [Mobiluncus curtisii]NMX13307.1 sodium:proton antiporter [Mobiluncus curtisii]